MVETDAWSLCPLGTCNASYIERVSLYIQHTSVHALAADVSFNVNRPFVKSDQQETP